MAEIRVFPTPTIPESSFVHLHVHSDYSLKAGSSSLYSLIAKAKSLNMKSIALTDINNMIGVLDFEKICRANGINPIVGEEIVVCEDEDYFNLVLLCRDTIGYKNLCQISGIIYAKKFTARKHFISIEELKNFSEGLICLSGGKNGAFYSLIQNGNIDAAEKRAVSIRKIFRENFYLEVQNHGLLEESNVSNQLTQIGQKLHIQTVLTNEVNYCNKKDAVANEVLKSIHNRTAYPGDPTNCEWYLKSENQMKEFFPGYSEAYTNTLEIASKCNLHIPTYAKSQLKDFLPQIVPPNDFCINSSQKENQQELIRRLLNAGLKTRYKYISDKIRARADSELELIFFFFFTNFLLMIWEYVNWAKEQDIIVGLGSGDIIESVVAYALEITDIDPLKYNLPFERFINEETDSLPNIDIEFGSEKISRLMQHIKALYGEKKAANIISIKQYRGEAVKNLLEDIGHVLEINPEEIKSLVEKFPKNFSRLKDAFTEPTDFTPDFGKLIPYRNDPRYEKLFNVAFKLEGSISKFTIHPSGVVISNADLCTLVPVCSDPKTEELVTQYTAEQLADCGLYIFDLIDSFTETFIRKCEDMIVKNHPEDKFSINQIPLYDEETYKFFSSGETDDIPGFENPETQEILRNLKPNNFDELTALYTMNRPGQSNQILNYISRKENPSLIEYPDVSLKPILKETYGLVIYQEQMMYCMQKLTGKSLGEVNRLRKILNQTRNESYESVRQDFISKIVEHDFTQENAEKLFDRIAMTSTFGYLKADAISSTKTSYLMAWMKVHYPEEFNSSKNTMTSKHWWENYFLEI